MLNALPVLCLGLDSRPTIGGGAGSTVTYECALLQRRSVKTGAVNASEQAGWTVALRHGCFSCCSLLCEPLISDCFLGMPQ